MLVHDKLTLALSVPDITAHVNQQSSPEKQGHTVLRPSGQWTSCSVPIQQQADILTNLNMDARGNAINSQYDALPRCQYKYPGRGNHDKKTVLVMEPGGDTTTTLNSGNPNTLAILGPDGSALSGSSGGGASGSGHGWFNGLLGCLRPVWTILGKANHDLKHLNQSELPPKALKSYK